MWWAHASSLFPSAARAARSLQLPRCRCVVVQDEQKEFKQEFKQELGGLKQELKALQIAVAEIKVLLQQRR